MEKKEKKHISVFWLVLLYLLVVFSYKFLRLLFL